MEIIKERARLAKADSWAEQAAITPAAVLDAFNPAWLDADQVRDWLLRRLHPRGPVCPDCGIPRISRRKWQAFYAGRRLQCTQCGRFYSATSGTLLEGAKITPAQLVLLALCQALDLPIPTTADLCGVNANTIRFWRNRLEAAA
jgi:transposase-like protein